MAGPVVSLYRRSRTHRLIEFGLTTAGFAIVYGSYLAFFNTELPVSDTLIGGAGSLLGFWLATLIKDNPEEAGSYGVILLEQSCFGAGVSLLVHALVTYGLLTRRTPFLVAGASLTAAILVTAFRRWRHSQTASAARILIAGFDSLCARVMAGLHQPVIGIWGPLEAIPPAGAPHIGGEWFREAVEKVRPTMILIGCRDWAKLIEPEDLLHCRLSGIQVTDCPTLYEKLFSRVCCERLQPVDLALSSSLRGDSRTMAIQAVYNNLIGLCLLLMLLPLMVLIAVAILLTSGKGGAIESVECAGFQYIPYRLHRFRTTRLDGSRTPVGQLLRRLRIVNLPQLFNVVRGDMALVGPRPVRSEFARRLTAHMPFYAHRFSVKPGFGGWAQMHLGAKWDRDTRREIEYDLFYIKEGSIWLDLEILLERAFGGRRRRSAEPSAAIRATAADAG